MTIKPITSLDEFMPYIPCLLELHKSLKGKFEPDLTSAQFCSKLIENFPDLFLFGEIEDGRLLYFIAAGAYSNEAVSVWHFYVDKSLYGYSTDFTNQLKLVIKSHGYSRITSNTNRLTRSYARWMSKIGMKPTVLTYQMEI